MNDSLKTGVSYRHSQVAPCSHDYIHPVVAAICRRHGSKRILDVGCGNGSLCRVLAESGCDVVGIDASGSGVARARELAPECVFYEKSVYEDPSEIREKDFDAVISTEVVEHLYRPAALLEFASMKLSDQGVLILSTPYHGYLKNLVLALLNRWDSHHSPLWDGGHIKFWSRRSLTALLESCGFEVEAFCGAGRFPWFWKSMIIVARKRTYSHKNTWRQERR